MTEKRYILSHNGKEDGILDKTNDKRYYGFELARLVNELSEENEKLKQDRDEMFIRERDKKNEWRKLKEENEKLKKEFYYKIRIFEQYDCSEDILISHNKQFTEFELSSIVQEAIDKVVEKYSKTDYSNSEWCPCNQKISLFKPYHGGYPGGLFGSVLSFLRYDYGFEIIIPYEEISIQRSYLFNKEFNDDTQTYLFKRYKDLVLGECKDCFRENRISYDGCPVENKRRRQLEEVEE